MIDKETYEKEIIRMWDSLRDDYIGYNTCRGVMCKMCPLHDILVDDIRCGNAIYTVKMINIVEKWAKENPPKKYKVSKMEYDILEINLKYIRKYHWKFNQARKLCDLLEKGYFEGATSETYINDYFDNCELDCELGENKNVKRRKV